MGADAAQMAGELAALSLLADEGHAIDRTRSEDLQQELARIGRFRQGLETAFPFPENWATNTADDTLICRCEEISAGQIRTVVDNGHWEINRVKAMCRVGMGRCQGRICGSAAAEIVAQRCALPVESVGRLRAQAPIKPLPFGLETEQ
jgi:bacterioferritin-associated ferredoxin